MDMTLPTVSGQGQVCTDSFSFCMQSETAIFLPPFHAYLTYATLLLVAKNIN